MHGRPQLKPESEFVTARVQGLAPWRRRLPETLHEWLRSLNLRSSQPIRNVSDASAACFS